MKRKSSLLLRNGCWIALALVQPVATQAASILLDFGPTTVLAADALRDPGHASGAVTNTETTWNRITGDTNTLYYGDGTLATGVTLELGRSTAVGPIGDDTINFADNGFNATLAGTSLTTGIYANTSPVRDGILRANGALNFAWDSALMDCRRELQNRRVRPNSCTSPAVCCSR
jgi:hypothetical protein